MGRTFWLRLSVVIHASISVYRFRPDETVNQFMPSLYILDERQQALANDPSVSSSRRHSRRGA
jgi:hypothetical protein